MIIRAILFVLLIKASYGVDYRDYDYGDLSIHYDSVSKGETPHKADGAKKSTYSPEDAMNGEKSDDSSIKKMHTLLDKNGSGRSSHVVKEPKRPPLPLCCREGEISDFNGCMVAPVTISWRPKLDGYSDAKFEHAGYPRCDNKDFVPFYQKDIMFRNTDGSIFLPFYVQNSAIPRKSYCIAKVADENSGINCEDFQTQIFACIRENESTPALIWVAGIIAHLLLLCTIVLFVINSDLRKLQGQSMIFFLISLLIYNICQIPGSTTQINVDKIACTALDAIKHFFFCGTFLWFNVIAFDVWRSIKYRRDYACKTRLFFYSLFAWLCAAIFTVAMLILPYTTHKDNGERDPVVKPNKCHLPLGVDITLQIAQTISVLISVVFLIMSSISYYNGYCKYGYDHDLPKKNATLCFQQSWKLFCIIVAHVLSSVDTKFMSFPLPMYQYILIESVAIFGVFAYRRSLIKWISKGACLKGLKKKDLSLEEGSIQEKGQLTHS